MNLHPILIQVLCEWLLWPNYVRSERGPFDPYAMQSETISLITFIVLTSILELIWPFDPYAMQSETISLITFIVLTSILELIWH